MHILVTHWQSGYAAQGDGEVCDTAFHTSVRLTVLKARQVPPVQLAPCTSPASEDYVSATCAGPDIPKAARTAACTMITVFHAADARDGRRSQLHRTSP
ncbi:hypothetical protein FOMPIDRAFT_1054203 [Fomitopsis schrenkii]|uniref:Uncharacterized protein n=1 Tax=Fomitopsis schrenkii TaxID=2126942 RepID=S8DRU6_FOMSC|nr:hypothetical protein FOMPIDRAFT_1054203 [Fomitopsis schrenkii]